MANAQYGKVWYVDTAGVLSRTPVRINAVTHYPAAVTDIALFHYWMPNLAEASGDTLMDQAETGTITGNDTLTVSAGTYLPSTIAGGDFFAITYSNGSADNWYNKTDKSELVCLVKTAGNNTVVVVHDDPWTNEATKKYTWKVYTGLKAIAILQPTAANTMESKHIVFPNGGLWLPNLACETMTASSYCLVYLA